MNTSKSITLIALLLTLTGAAMAQTKHRPAARAIEPRVCRVVPRGMVLVGYKPNAACPSGRELVVRKPKPQDVICADSPMPSGYQVAAPVGDVACFNTSQNPLTNALSIYRGSAPTALTRRETVYTAEQNMDFALALCRRDDDDAIARLTAQEARTGYRVSNMAIVNISLGRTLCEARARGEK